MLSFDLQTANAWFGQMVVVTKGGIKVRDRLKRQFEEYLRTTFPGTDTFVKLLEVGPPVGRPVQYRLSGPDIAKVKELSESLAAIVRSNPHLNNVVFNWMEPARVVKVDVLQDKARQLGVSSEDISATLNSVLNGTSITQVRDSIYLVNVVDRALRRKASVNRHAAQLAAYRSGRAKPCRSAPLLPCAMKSSSRPYGGGRGSRRSRYRQAFGTMCSRARWSNSLHRTSPASQSSCRVALRSRSEARSRKAPRAKARSRPSFH